MDVLMLIARKGERGVLHGWRQLASGYDLLNCEQQMKGLARFMNYWLTFGTSIKSVTQRPDHARTR